MNLSLPNEGLLLINKPAGKTSFHLVHCLRRLTGIQKIGHAGTLDPFATGVMVLLIGKSFTRQSDQFLNHDKEYLATLILGKTSTTYDPEGVISPISEEIPSLEAVHSVIEAFQGEQLQIPPMFSAKKVQGKKLYELARKGVEIVRQPQKVHLTISLIEYHYPSLTIKVQCSKGTYIRSLAHDIGSQLKTGAYLDKLIRLRSGPFLLEECVEYDSLSFAGFNYRHHLKNF